MKKITSAMILVCVIATMFAGCTTTHHRVAIGNVPGVREINIRNAGTTSWGPNVAGENLDMSRFSGRVDIRVIDAQGVVHSRHDVPFDETAFALTSSERYMGVGTSAFVLTLLLAALIPLLILGDFDSETEMAVGGIRW